MILLQVIEKERSGSGTSHGLQLVFIMLGSATIIALKVTWSVLTFHQLNLLLFQVLEDVIGAEEENNVAATDTMNNTMIPRL